MKLHILGTAGYHPTESRHTTCLMVPSAGLVLDAGTAFFRVRDLLQTPNLDILMTHVHLDHVCGLTFLLDVLYDRQVQDVVVHGRPVDLQTITNDLFGKNLFPVEFRWKTAVLDGAATIGQWHVRTRHQRHPGGSLGYRLDGPGGRSFAFLTDTTCDPEDASVIHFLEGVDLLIHECNFRDEFADFAELTGHATAGAVGALAKKAGVRRLIVTHVNPLDGDAELAGLLAQVHRHFPAAILAEDRMVVDL